MSDLIFGYTWEEIQAAQRGEKLHKTFLPTPDNSGIKITSEEMELFEKVGISGLEQLGYYGLIDRLERKGLVSK